MRICFRRPILNINALHLSDNAQGGGPLQSGRAFQFEREMSAPSRDWLKRQGLIIKEEFSTPWGICDLVGVSFAQERVLQRLSLGQREPIGPPFRIALLNRIPDSQTGKTVALDGLEREFNDFLTPSEIQRALKSLVESGFVVTVHSGCLQKLNGWAPLHWRIVALELKLRRVEEALNQARSHLRFATHSYVGLPSELALRVAQSSRRRDFLNFGVGIVAVSPTHCQVVVRSRGQSSAEQDKVLQMHCVERFWRTRVRDN